MELMLSSIERSAHLIGAYLDRTAGDLGITQGEAHVLAELARRGPTPIGELHREFGHKRSTLTNLVDRLERRELVARAINPADRRSFVISLTATGQVMGRRVLTILDELEAQVRAAITERDAQAPFKISQALATVLGALPDR